MTAVMNLNLPISWHVQCEWEGDVEYDRGYRAGYIAAERDIAAEICAALGRPPADAKAVIRWLVRTTGTTWGATA